MMSRIQTRSANWSSGWVGCGVETREFDDELVRSVDRYLRISPPWRSAQRIRMVFHCGQQIPRLNCFATLPDDARIGKTREGRTTSEVSRFVPLSQRPNDQSHMAETPCENPMAHVHGKAMFV